MGQGYRFQQKAAKEAEFFFYEDIGPSFFGGIGANDFAKDLKKAGDVETIRARINSYGGDVFEGLTIFNLLASHPAKKVIYIDGIAASIASVIAMAGNEILAAENSFVMVHDAWGVSQGNAAEMRQFADKLEMVSGAIADVYAKRTGQPRDAIVAMMHAETWMDAGAALERGFASSVTENQKMAAKFDPTKHKFKNAPISLKGSAIPAVGDNPRPLVDAARQRIARMEARRLLNSRPE